MFAGGAFGDEEFFVVQIHDQRHIGLFLVMERQVGVDMGAYGIGFVEMVLQDLLDRDSIDATGTLLQDFSGPVIPHDGIGPQGRGQIRNIGIADLAVIGVGDDAVVRKYQVESTRRRLKVDGFPLGVADEIIGRGGTRGACDGPDGFGHGYRFQDAPQNGMVGNPNPPAGSYQRIGAKTDAGGIAASLGNNAGFHHLQDLGPVCWGFIQNHAALAHLGIPVPILGQQGMLGGRGNGRHSCTFRAVISSTGRCAPLAMPSISSMMPRS